MINVYILCGGPSSEHDIALRSALNIYKNLDKEKYDVKVVYIDKEGKFSNSYIPNNVEDEFDLVKEVSINKAESIAKFLNEISKLDKDNTIVIPAIHGVYGEDGTIQGFLDVIGINYIGNGLLSSVLCMDKASANDIFAVNNIDQAKYLVATKANLNDDFIDKCINDIGLPLIVKPSANGSSLGVARVDKKEELKDAILFASKYDKKVLVEELIDGQEIEIAVIGEGNDLDVTLPAAYKTKNVFLDYDAKYFDQETIEELPYQMDDEDMKKARDFAKKCYQILGCEGFARVDIFYTKDSKLYINEINTFPGFTKTSFFPRLAMNFYDETFSSILDRLIEDAFRSKND